MLKKSTTIFSKKRKPKAQQQQNNEIEAAIDWEVRPGGMLVQKRLSGSDPTHPILNIKVSHDSYHHLISIPSVSTFGDLKEILAGKANLEVKDQRLLFRGKEKGDRDRLDMAGVKDTSKVILLEDPASKESKLFHKTHNRANVQAYEAVMKVRTEVDELSIKVTAMEASSKNSINIVHKEIEILTELLMKELLKLDRIDAEGEAKSQRRIEVCRVQGFVDILDNLKLITTANHFKPSVVPAVFETTKWDSGVANQSQTTPKITKNWERFE